MKNQKARGVVQSVRGFVFALIPLVGCSANADPASGSITCSSSHRCEQASCSVAVDAACDYACSGTSSCTLAGGSAVSAGTTNKLDCTIDSHCDLTSAGEWELTCSNAAVCTAQAPKDAVYRLTCNNQSTCNVKCEVGASCTLACSNMASCTLTCPAGATCSCASDNDAPCTCTGDGCTEASSSSGSR